MQMCPANGVERSSRDAFDFIALTRAARRLRTVDDVARLIEI